jgi:hypothetical protein
MGLAPARFVEAPYLFERWKWKVGSTDFIFWMLGLIFALSALGKIYRLELLLKNAGILKETNDSG